MTAAGKKIAVLSHILPPSPSGQAMVLEALLDYLDPADYCLISQQMASPDAHAANYYPLVPRRARVVKWLQHLPQINPDKDTRWHRVLRPLLWVYHSLQTQGTLTGGPDAVVKTYADQIEAIVRREGCGLIVACTGDLYNLPAAYTVHQRTGLPYVAYIFDDYGYQWTGTARMFALEWEPRVLKAARAVMVTNEFMARAYQERHGVTSTIIRNPAALPDLTALDRGPRVLDARMYNVVYTGSVYSAHYDAFRCLIEALDRLARPEVRLHIFTSQPVDRLNQEGIKGPYVEIHPHFSHDVVLAVQRHANALFLPLSFESPFPEVINTSSPGKLGEYLAVGRPILVNAPPDSFLCWYFRERGCGEVVDRRDAILLASSVQRLMSDDEYDALLGKRARECASIDFDVCHIGHRFAAVLHRMVS